MNRLLRIALATLLLVNVIGSFAHEGAKPHGGRGAAVTREQKDWGIAGDPKAATRTIRIAMGDDMRFSPDTIAVNQGETVRIVVRNKGAMLHEFVLGTGQELEAHAALMRKFPTMVHDEPYMVHVAPGRTEQIVWTFNRAGRFGFACLVAGHYEAGMAGKVRVDARQAAAPAQR